MTHYIPCPKCKNAQMEMFGVTERGAHKYACPRCYHKTEVMKARILNPRSGDTERKLPRVTKDDIAESEHIKEMEKKLKVEDPYERDGIYDYLGKKIRDEIDKEIMELVIEEVEKLPPKPEPPPNRIIREDLGLSDLLNLWDKLRMGRLKKVFDIMKRKHKT